MKPAAAVKKIAYAGIVVLWVAVTAALIARHRLSSHTGTQTPYSAVLPGEFFGERWMGVYFRGRKIGHSRRTFERTKSGYRMSEGTTVHLTVMDTTKEIRTDTEAVLSSGLSLEEFHAVVKADADIDVRGTVRGRELIVTVTTAGGSSSRVIPLRQRPSLTMSMLPALFEKGIEKGKRFEVTIIDPFSFTQEQVPVEVVDKERIEARGQVFDAYRLKGSFKGTDFFVWLTGKGDVLKEESPSGFTLIAESRDEALRGVGASADVALQASLPFAMRLPAETRYLKIRISGINPRELALEGGRQHFRDGILDISREDLKSVPRDRAAAAQEKIEADRFLQESALVQSKDRRIVSLATDIVRGERDPLKAARLIFDWVYGNIQKTPSVTFPSAVDILVTRKGDCNEHTTLYTALARAASIPARMAAGLVYKNGRLYYHAWPEIFVGRWIAVDPTFGQFPADAGHIRLVTGDIDQQVKLISVIGKIKIEGIEYR